jgi:hypothetical protein
VPNIKKKGLYPLILGVLFRRLTALSRAWIKPDRLTNKSLFILSFSLPFAFSTLPFPRGLPGVTGRTLVPCLACHCVAFRLTNAAPLSEIISFGGPKVWCMELSRGIVGPNIRDLRHSNVEHRMICMYKTI